MAVKDKWGGRGTGQRASRTHHYLSESQPTQEALEPS